MGRGDPPALAARRCPDGRQVVAEIALAPWGAAAIKRLIWVPDPGNDAPAK